MNATLTKEEIAKLLQVSQRTIDSLRQKGLPYFNVGRSVRFDKDDVVTWLRRQSITTETEGDKVSMN